MREFFSPLLIICKRCILLLICLLVLNKVVKKKKNYHSEEIKDQRTEISVNIVSEENCITFY